MHFVIDNVWTWSKRFWSSAALVAPKLTRSTRFWSQSNLNTLSEGIFALLLKKTHQGLTKRVKKVWSQELEVHTCIPARCRYLASVLGVFVKNTLQKALSDSSDFKNVFSVFVLVRSVLRNFRNNQTLFISYQTQYAYILDPKCQISAHFGRMLGDCALKSAFH